MTQFEEIHYRLNTARDNLSPVFIEYLVRALTCLDDKLIDKISDEVIFYSSDISLGCCFLLHDSYYKGRKAIIFFSEPLLKKKEKEILHTILHEIAHYYLKHKREYDISIEESDRQEKEADELATRWLKNYTIK